MRHEHLVVTVEAELKERVEDDLEPGESLEAWVADAVERKLDEQRKSEADDEAGDRDAGVGDETRRESRRGRREETADGRFDERSEGGRFGDGSGDGRGDDGDGYDEGFEFVDDCSI